MFQEEKKNIEGNKGSYWHWLRGVLKVKRDRLYNILCDARLNPILPQGGYFMLADISNLRDQLEAEGNDKPFDERFVEWLIKKRGVAALPVSAFYSQANKCDKFIRFCFIKDDTTIDAAEEKIKSIEL